MRVFVDDDSCLKRAVPHRRRVVPQIHAHTTWLTVRRGGEISVVDSTAVLGIQNHKVLAKTALTVVVDLEVASYFIEAEFVKKVVVAVGSVE